ncbi:MAG TPA: Mut7-C RNAse domain-containing protein [Chloroflexota bacterium]|nr:Mut7-C RNAse domain-containing protein [Chloroflexota bacterium]
MMDETPSPAFLVDQNVASLARRLRWLGYDAAEDPAADDARLVVRAELERRMLLTRDRGILQRRPVASGAVSALWLRSDDPWQQLAQVVQDTGIDPVRYAFSRCVRCNVPLEPAPPAVAVAAVPPFVARTQTQFTRCPNCGRFFWRGTHWQRMREHLQAHLATTLP